MILQYIFWRTESWMNILTIPDIPTLLVQLLGLGGVLGRVGVLPAARPAQLNLELVLHTGDHLGAHVIHLGI